MIAGGLAGDGNTMTLQTDHEAEKTEQHLVKEEYRHKDRAFWKRVLDDMQQLPALGMQDIKWRELYCKYRVYIPPEVRQQSSFKYYREAPSKEKLDKIKENTKAAKAARAERSRSDKDGKDMQQQAKKPAAAVILDASLLEFFVQPDHYTGRLSTGPSTESYSGDKQIL